MDAAYVDLGAGVFRATKLTRGPWHPDHQHAGPPSALICRAIERVAAKEGLTHLARLTVNLMRPAPIGECLVEVAADYVGRNAGHFSGRLTAEGKESARFTALLQREEDLPVPKDTLGHPPPAASKPPNECPLVKMPMAELRAGYGELVEN
ncbi:MAG TPA: acyl-CoA thioesterase domain-containing protein [Roseiarcus sp.]